jgi:hypothetical protein
MTEVFAELGLSEAGIVQGQTGYQNSEVSIAERSFRVLGCFHCGARSSSSAYDGMLFQRAVDCLDMLEQ